MARLGVDARRLAFARTGDTEHKIEFLALVQPCERALTLAARVEIDYKNRLTELMRANNGVLGAGRCEPAPVEQQQQPVAVAYVPFGALRRVGEQRLL